MGKTCNIRALREKVPSDPVKLNQRLADVGSNLGNPVANENPGALAGATGADSTKNQFWTEEYRSRADAATMLCHAIANCHRDDAVTILSAALVDLSGGMPLPIWIDALSDARAWAAFATEIERKAFALATFETMLPASRAAFLDRIHGRVAA